MKKLITILVASTMLAATPAAAKVAVWKETQKWTVFGNPDVPYCSAIAQFSRQTINVSLNAYGFSLIVSGVDAGYAGKTFNIPMAANGAYGVLQGTAINGNTVTFNRLAPETVLNLARARTLAIAGLGQFSMRGSFEAIGEVMACYQAITGQTI